MGAVLKKMTDIIKRARLDELFALWDSDQSGFLETDELNRVVGIFNGDDWDALTVQEKEEQADKFVNKFDAGEVPACPNPPAL
jgi:Ca2+-binding EF-hand superfamily protein